MLKSPTDHEEIDMQSAPTLPEEYALMPPMAMVRRLRTNVYSGNLKEKDAAFAADLLRSYDRKGLSEKQEFWARVLLYRAERPAEAVPAAKPREQVALADDGADAFSALVGMFQFAGQRLKHPSVLISVPGCDRPIRLSVAGPNTRAPGTINVADKAPFGQGSWYGRILANGKFEQSPRVAQPAHLVERLRLLARDPAGVAAAYGREMGSCCFCGLTLTDERSVRVGYGPICAENYNLPWGA